MSPYDMYLEIVDISVTYESTLNGIGTTGRSTDMAGAGGEKRKRRCVMATDSEWSRMRERAAEDRLSCSEFIVQRCLHVPEPAAPETALPAQLLRRIARSVLVLEEMERLRLIREGAEGDWKAALDRADRWLDGEAALG